MDTVIVLICAAIGYFGSEYIRVGHIDSGLGIFGAGIGAIVGLAVNAFISSLRHKASEDSEEFFEDAHEIVVEVKEVAEKIIERGSSKGE